MYFVRARALSSSCEQCGNIEYHPEANVRHTSISDQGLGATRAEWSAEDELEAADLQLNYSGGVGEELSASVTRGQPLPAEALTVDAILLQNQQEWQLWAELVAHFHDENNHQAYLSFVAHNLLFAKAIERYTKHRQTFLRSANNRWQAEIADRKLEAIASICQVQLERSREESENQAVFWDSLLLSRSAAGSRLRPYAALFFLALGLFFGAAGTIFLAL